MYCKNRTLINNILFVFLSLIFFSTIGCRKFIDVDPPPTSVTGDNVYGNDITATAVLTGLYARISTSAYTSTNAIGCIGRLASLSADELSLWNGLNSPTLQGYYQNSLTETANSSVGGQFWQLCYSHIYACNSAIDGLSASTALTPVVKQQLLGEAKFMRAFFYFYLVNFYGGIPLVLTTDYSISSSQSRAPIAKIYQQIVLDLKEAQDLLNTQYLDISLLKSTTERVRPTKWAATALLARAYLYNSDWVNAEAQATMIINNTALYDTVSLNSVFLKNSKETIWQLQPVNANWNTEEARAYIIPTTGFSANNPYSISNSLLNSFESGDQRRVNGNWIKSITLGGLTYYYPYKYKSATNGASVIEYWTVFRLGEQYLIRAEARAQLNKIAEAQSDLNVIRKRAGLANTAANDQSSLLTAIFHEKQVELFTEWGQRWFDLKRTGNINSVMSIVTPTKGGTWEATDQLYPLPFYDLQRNPNLIQNPGY